MTSAPEPPSPLRRLIPLLIVAALVAMVLAMGWHRVLSLKTVGLNYEVLKAVIGAHPVLSALGFGAAYAAVVAMSLPGATIMTLAGGLLLGWAEGTVVSVVSATIGATALFAIARSSLGEGLASRAGPWVARLRDGFRDNALHYMLFLRLVPVFPFFVVNLVPAFLGVRLGTFVAATAVGIIPGTAAYSIAGAGLASVVEAQNKVYRECLARVASVGNPPCDYRIDTSHLVTTELIVAFVALGFVALIPVAVKTWSKRHAAA